MNRTLTMTILAGRPAIVDHTGRALITDLRVGVEYPGATWNHLHCWADGPWTQSGSDGLGTLRCGSAVIEYRPMGEGLALRASYTHQGERLAKTRRFFALHGLWRCGFDRALVNEPTEFVGVAVNEMESCIHTVRFSEGQRVTGTENVAIIDREGANALLGYVSFENWFGSFELGAEGRVRAWCQLEGRPMENGETVTSDWLYVGLCDDVRWGLMDYARLTADEMHSRAGVADTPYGFCTWYYYGNGLKPQTVYENLEALGKNRDRLDVRYFNLDDGWYREWGDWTENEKFACGMKKIADDIREAGYLPGIWLAPFGAKKPSKLYDEHPDWFVRKWDSDEPVTNETMWGCYLSVDMSHPGVKQWIHDLYHQISCEWGYRHIKIDIISPNLMPGRYYDPSFNTMKNYREGLRLIREAITTDTALLTCTAPMGGAIGYADGMRTSQDIFDDWECLLPMFNQNLKRYYYNKLWFNNDPDCLLVRNARNEDAECIRQCSRTDAENRTFATAIMATGGAMLMSDKMPLLEEYQLELLRKMFPINTRAAVPLDLMESEVPGILDLGRRGRTHIFALINWSDAVRGLEVNVGEGEVFEFWAQEYLGRMQGVRSFTVEPHGAKVLFVTDPAPIAVVGADDCMCPEIAQICENGTLEGRFVKAGECLSVVAEGPIEAVHGCTVEPDEDVWKVRQCGEGLTFAVKHSC